MKRIISLMAYLAILPATAFASGGDLWILPVTMICHYQYPEYDKLADLKLGDMPESLADFRRIPLDRTSPVGKARSACYQSAPWLSKGLCDEVMAVNEESKLKEIYYRHAREIASLGPLVDQFMQINQSKSAAEIKCPVYSEFQEQKRKVLETDVKNNLACQAVDAESFTRITGRPAVLLPTGNGPFSLSKSLRASCFYDADKNYVVDVSLSPQLPDDSPVTCQEAKNPDPVKGRRAGCSATKQYWRIWVTGSADAQDKLQALAQHVLDHTDFPQDEVENFRKYLKPPAK
ncbi:MAG TPA: hypothetical protein VL381_10510 [Rhodocyclaceae bacterium]|jgi:hypothetical protein|nr:hypothetical protein [Rhodocyclaceae bacterium]